VHKNSGYLGVGFY